MDRDSRFLLAPMAKSRLWARSRVLMKTSTLYPILICLQYVILVLVCVCVSVWHSVFAVLGCERSLILFFGLIFFSLIRFLREMIDTYILTPEIVPTLLLAARTTLFPSNSRPNNTAPNNEKAAAQQQQQSGTSSNVDSTPHEAKSKTATGPSASEIRAIKRQCATDILSLLPRSIAQAFFRGTVGGGDDGGNTAESTMVNHNDVDATTVVDDDDETTTLLLEAIEMDLLDPFSDAYCNKHLIFAVIESVLVKLLPELSERGITELMEERGVSL